MTRAANELWGTAQKAARGAGFPVAQTQLFAAALLRHIAAGRPEDQIAQALIHTDESPILTLPALLDGALIEGRATLQGSLTPDLALSYAETHAWQTQVVRAGRALHLICDGTRAAPRPLPERLHISDRLWAHLGQLAAKTYVPATAASRLSGAGAGLSDND